jgi:hypothetical protein
MAGVEAPSNTEAVYTARSAQPRWHATPRKQEASGLTAPILPPEASAGRRSGPVQPLDQRHRLSHWAALGLLPDVTGCSIAAAYTRATGRPPARDPELHAYRVYARWELQLALAELGLQLRTAPPPPDPALPLIWAAALTRLPLPSTRMLLSREAWLRSLQEISGRVVAQVVVEPAWRTTVKSRCCCLAVALSETLACPVAVEVA